MDPLVLTILLFALLIGLLIIGIPIAFALSFLAIAFTVYLWGPSGLLMISSRAYAEVGSFILVAIPLFIFMAVILENTNIADDLYEMMYRWMGSIPGGLASGTIVVSAIFAAMAGVSSVATVTMGLIAYPAMAKRGYNKKMVAGGIALGGSLGIIIPPSIIAILYGSITGTSIGKLFMGGFIPGILIALGTIAYITLKCMINPANAPMLPKEERATWEQKMASLKSVILPLLLIIVVLGGIYSGLATPTEASGIGAFGALVCGAAQGTLSWRVVQNAALRTLNVTCMVMWIIIGAYCFTTVYNVGGASDLMLSAIKGLNISPMTTIIFMQIIFFILGMFIDPAGMIMICCPVFIPIVEALGFDTTWFGILFIVNTGIAYCSPPFGFNLFVLKSIIPDLQLTDLYKAVWPYIAIMAAMIVLMMIFPDFIMWLPNKIG